MKTFFTSLLFIAVISTAYSQKKPVHKPIAKAKKINYDGQWRGGFNDGPSSYSSIGNFTVGYVLELNVNGTQISGASYSYFTQGEQKYYTICRVSGVLDPDSKSMEVIEVERTKSNTPPFFTSCLQIHKLQYTINDEGNEELRGTWIPAPNQISNCGTGVTVLTRRLMNMNPLGIRTNPNPGNTTAKAPTPNSSGKPSIIPTPKREPSVALKKSEGTEKPSTKEIKKPQIILNSPSPLVKVAPPVSDAPPKDFESRRKDIVKIIKLEQPTFRLDFYDNGEIDGDSISVFYNGKLVLSNQRISDKPLTLFLEYDKNIKENLLTMYAENLGTIPPNTAVMIVTDGRRRYEVRLESDLKKSGSVIFTRDDPDK